MTDKEVRKLKRPELLEILFYMQKEIESLKQDNENLRRQMESMASGTGISDADVERIAAAVAAAMQNKSGNTAKKPGKEKTPADKAGE